METTSLIPVLGILALAVAVVILLLHFMRRARHPAKAHRPETARAGKETPASLSKEEQEYLDSSHIGGPILPSGQDGLDTRVDAWRNNKRK